MTDHEKERIRQMRIAGQGYCQIAKALNCPEATIKSFCRRQGLLDKSLASRVSMNACQQCGLQLEPGKIHRLRRFCSDRCRYRWWNAHRQMRHTVAMNEKACPVCHGAFRAYDKGQTYCSRRCYFAARLGKAGSTYDR